MQIPPSPTPKDAIFYSAATAAVKLATEGATPTRAPSWRDPATRLACIGGEEYSLRQPGEPREEDACVGCIARCRFRRSRSLCLRSPRSPRLHREMPQSLTWRSEERRVGKECRSRWSP